MRGRPLFVEDAEAFPAEAYRVDGWPAVAWVVWGWEIDAETLARTGRVVAMMKGDDERHLVEAADLVALEDGAWCGGCGQIGCRA